MSFFIDKQNRRKSPIAIAALGAAMLDLCVYGVLYALLAGPLYRHVTLESGLATTVVHALVIAVLGTAVCCLLFLLKDKRVVPYGFAGLAVALCMFYAAAMLLEGAARTNMLALISMYGLAPVLLGNLISWPIYLQMKRRNPALNHRKTIQEELREAMEKDAARQAKRKERRPAATEPPKTAGPETTQPAPEELSAEEAAQEALFGPEASGKGPAAFRSAQEEAMLFYEDDEEASDD